MSSIDKVLIEYAKLHVQLVMAQETIASQATQITAQETRIKELESKLNGPKAPQAE